MHKLPTKCNVWSGNPQTHWSVQLHWSGLLPTDLTRVMLFLHLSRWSELQVFGIEFFKLFLLLDD